MSNPAFTGFAVYPIHAMISYVFLHFDQVIRSPGEVSVSAVRGTVWGSLQLTETFEHNFR